MADNEIDNDFRRRAAERRAEHRARKSSFLKAVGGWLKQYGFRRDGSVFRRTAGIDTHIIQLDGTPSGSFHVLIGVFFPELGALLSDDNQVLRSKRGPDIWDCKVVTYLSSLAPGEFPDDGIWCSEDMDWVCEQIEALALPWLDLTSSPAYEPPDESIADAMRKLWATRSTNGTAFVVHPLAHPFPRPARPRHEGPTQFNQQITITVPLSDTETGNEQDEVLVVDLMKQLNALADHAGVGYAYQSSLGSGLGAVELQGPDADALFEVIEAHVRARLQGKGCRVVLRYGRPFFASTIERAIDID